MESEKSRIPVYSFQNPRAIPEPKDTHQPPSKKQCLNKLEDSEPLKNPDFTFVANVPLSVAFKDTYQRAPKSAKKGAPPPPKKAMTVWTYKKDLDLKNKKAETVKCELSMKLAGTQKKINEVEEKCDRLEKENEQLKRFQKNCLLIMESRNGVAGTNILEEAEESEKSQSEIMDLSEKLKADLQLFIQTAKEQTELFQSSQTKWKQVEEEEARFLEQQQLFHKEMEELLTTLNCEEEILNPT